MCCKLRKTDFTETKKKKLQVATFATAACRAVTLRLHLSTFQIRSWEQLVLGTLGGTTESND